MCGEYLREYVGHMWNIYRTYLDFRRTFIQICSRGNFEEMPNKHGTTLTKVPHSPRAKSKRSAVPHPRLRFIDPRHNRMMSIPRRLHFNTRLQELEMLNKVSLHVLELPASPSPSRRVSLLTSLAKTKSSMLL